MLINSILASTVPYNGLVPNYYRRYIHPLKKYHSIIVDAAAAKQVQKISMDYNFAISELFRAEFVSV